MMDRVGPVGVRALVESLGSAAAIFEASEAAMSRVRGVGRATAAAIVSQRSTTAWEAEEERAQRAGARVVTFVDAEYPEPLKGIHDPPLALYVKGRLKAHDRHAVAVVGTRRPTRYGREVTRRFSVDLVGAGMTVVSGLAEGIDAVAHEAALEAGGRTLAVLGGGMDCLYPACNRDLAASIGDDGAVLREFPFGRRPDRTTFPMRNRVVSGLSMGVLVIEAGVKSGALITARQALEQGRQVFAVPGRIDSSVSFGTNALIRDGAPLVACADDILKEFEFLLPRLDAAVSASRRRDERGRKAALIEAESKVVECLRDGACPVDRLIRDTGLSASEMGAILVTLEMKRAVRMLPGRMVENVSDVP